MQRSQNEMDREAGMIDYMTPKQVAAKLQVSEQTVRNMFHAGQLKGVKVGPKLIRIDPASLGNVEPEPPRRRRVVKDWIGGGK